MNASAVRVVRAARTATEREIIAVLGAGAKVEPSALRLHLDHRPDLGLGHGNADLWERCRGAWAAWEG